MNIKDRHEMMANMPISKLILKMSIPTVISTMVMALYNIADTYFVSALGSVATAAVGANLTLMNFISMFGTSIALGANSFLARLLGQKENKKAEEVISFSFFCALTFGVFILIFGFLFLDKITNIIGAKGEIHDLSIGYTKYILIASPIMMGVFVLNQTLRAEGSAFLSMIGMLSGVLLNLILDPIFIYHLGFGVSGAAMATAISKLVSFLFLVAPYIARKAVVCLSVKNFLIKKDIIIELLKMGFPTFARTGLTTISMCLLNNVAVAFGTSVLAAMTASNRVMLLLSSAVLGFAQGYQPVAGFNWGAKKYNRVNDSFWFSMRTSVIITAMLSVIICMLSPQIMEIFSRSDDYMCLIGVRSLRLQCIVMPSVAWVIVVNMTYAGLGFATGAALLSIVRQGIFFLPALIILPKLFGVTGLICVQMVADFFSFLFCIPFTVRIITLIRRKSCPIDC